MSERRSVEDVRAAIDRVMREGSIPVAILALEVGITKESLIRWIALGKAGPEGRVFCDGVRCCGQWYSSREAVQRFLEVIESTAATMAVAA